MVTVCASLCCSFLVKDNSGVKQPPVKVGSGVANAQGVFLFGGTLTNGDYTITVDSAPNYVPRIPLPVSVMGRSWKCHAHHDAFFSHAFVDSSLTTTPCARTHSL
jgi:hypothetical protein